MSDQIIVTLHGLFSLRDGENEAGFLVALRAFYDHLVDLGYAVGYSVARREPLEGFGMPLPPFDYETAVHFESLEKDAACYEYVKRDEEPIHSLHRAMNSKVQRGSQHFFLTARITSASGTNG